MNWAILSLGAGLSSVGFNLINRHTLKDDADSTAYAWWFEVIRLGFFGCLALFNFQVVWTWQSLVALMSLGLTEFFCVFLYMKMHRLTELSLSTILIRLRLIWLPILAFVFIGERLEFLEYLGIGIIFAGIITTISPKKIKVNKGAKITLLVSFLGAFLGLFQKKSAMLASTPMVMTAMALPSVILLPLAMKDGKRRIKLAKKTLFKNLQASIFNITAMYLFTNALRLAPASKALGLLESTLIVSVLTGIILLKEKENLRRKLIGGAITLVGVILIIS